MDKPIQVLHIDDQPDFAELTVTFLERSNHHFTVETATSASEGLERLADEDFDCIVSDYDMPRQDGIKFLDTVREEYPDLPFILFTGKGSEEVASDAISAGVTDYLQKEPGTEQYTLLANRIENAVAQHRAEERVETTEQRYQRLIEESTDVITVIDGDGSFQYLSPAAERLFGYTAEELVGKNAFEYIHPDDRAFVMEQFADQVGSPERRVTAEFRFDHADGPWTWLEVRGRNLLDDPMIDGIVVYAREITNHKEHEQRLNSLHDATTDLIQADTHEAIAETAVETIRDILDMPINAVWLHDEADNTLKPTAVTDEGVDLLDEPPVFEPGESLSWEVFQSQESKVFENVASKPRRHNPETLIRSEIILPLGDHGVLNIGSTVAEEFDETDVSLAEILATSVEAALARADGHQELTRQHQRLDEFASVVSHDLRNPLNVAKGRLELAEMECDSEHLNEVADAHDRMQTLINDLLMLAREGESVTETERVSLQEIVDACWGTVATGAATLVTDTPQTIRADRRRLQQLFENLFRNAVDHGGEDATVTVGGLDGGFYVADDGPGISVSDRGDVFERGYSTTAEGTGFGLAIVQKIAESHGWNVCVTDSADGGARFEITGVEET